MLLFLANGTPPEDWEVIKKEFVEAQQIMLDNIFNKRSFYFDKLIAKKYQPNV